MIYISISFRGRPTGIPVFFYNAIQFTHRKNDALAGIVFLKKGGEEYEETCIGTSLPAVGGTGGVMVVNFFELFFPGNRTQRVRSVKPLCHKARLFFGGPAGKIWKTMGNGCKR